MSRAHYSTLLYSFPTLGTTVGKMALQLQDWLLCGLSLLLLPLPTEKS
jgi:hypothetical protein